jgi:spectinomycin phosphotransferase
VRPPDEATLRAALGDGYGLPIDRLEVELAGADALAWAWRATTRSGAALFVKLRPDVRPAAVLVPRHLHSIGLSEVVAALPTVGGEARLEVDGWTAVVTELVEGSAVAEAGLDPDGWRRLGAFSARLHAVVLPDELTALLRVEDFRSPATDRARALDGRLDSSGEAGLDEHSLAVRRRWIAERPTIARIVALSDEIGERIRARPDPERGPFVLCHADFHGGNVLIDRGGGLHVIDWDEVVLAPPERDLMFVRGSVVAGPVGDAEADAFEAGYGPLTVDLERLAWYRIDWAVQDVTGWAEEVLFQPDRDPPSRPRARRIFDGLFGPGSEVAGALAIAAELGMAERGDAGPRS